MFEIREAEVNFLIYQYLNENGNHLAHTRILSYCRNLHYGGQHQLFSNYLIDAHEFLKIPHLALR